MNGKMTTSARRSHAQAEILNTPIDQAFNEPLRARPLEKLAPNDFKINPKSNGGYKYAYNSVERGADNRRCLQGCTKPECCGAAFRAFAAAGRDWNVPISASQEERDDDLLEEFLGDNYYKIRNMNKQEKDEVLLQAKTRELANKHGRHRMAYERKKSPPGFWRMGFPSTQEREEDEEQVRVREREEVRQRYQEAQRPNGRYMFRDE